MNFQFHQVKLEEALKVFVTLNTENALFLIS